MVAPSTEHRVGERLAPGQTFGHYLIVRLLGKGGMGEVYEATDQDTQRSVALKVLAQKMDSPRDRERFLREGRLAAQISHPNSVYVFGAEDILGVPVISMELVPGTTLKERAKEHPLPVTEAVDAVLQVIEGLQAAHAKGLLHRDVKPSNCFVAADGRVKIGDFGLSISTLAREETQITATGSFVGTPAFASPEQLQGRELDVRSDIYSVGATLYFLLTAKTPFDVDNPMQSLAQMLETGAVSPEKLRPGLPAELARLVLRCLHKHKEKRFQDYASLRRALLMFSSRQLMPATLSRHLPARVLDEVPWGLAIAGSLVHPSLPDWSFLVILPVRLAVLSVVESAWGRSPGKAALRLSVVSEDGCRPDLKTSLRYYLFSSLPVLLLLLAFSEPSESSDFMRGLVSWFPLYLLVALGAYAAAAGFVDLESFGYRTLRPVPLPPPSAVDSQPPMFQPPDRVLGVDPMQKRPSGFWLRLTTPREVLGAGIGRVNRFVVQDRSAAPASIVQQAGAARRRVDSGPKLGPYALIRLLRDTPAEQIFLGFDEQLAREVWVQVRPGPAPPIALTRRDMARPTRLRWLNGHRSEQQSWDAFEAPSGRALLDLLPERQPWRLVRTWLVELVGELHSQAGELEEVSADGEPAIGLDRVWITDDNRLVLLDFAAPIPDSDVDVGSFRVSDVRELTQFLRRLVVSALEGQIAVETGKAAPRAPIPQHAGRLLSTLPELGGFDSVYREVVSIAEMKTDLTRWDRIAQIGWWTTVAVVSYSGVQLLRGPDSGLDVGREFSVGGAAVVAALFVFTRAVISAFSGIAVVRAGSFQPSAKLRVLREMVTWTPLVLVLLVLGLAGPASPPWLIAAVVALYAIGAAWAVADPYRTLPDRIAGTYLVPR